MHRRSFLAGLGAALFVAPAIVKSTSLMPVKQVVWTPRKRMFTAELDQIKRTVSWKSPEGLPVEWGKYKELIQPELEARPELYQTVSRDYHSAVREFEETSLFDGQERYPSIMPLSLSVETWYQPESNKWRGSIIEEVV